MVQLKGEREGLPVPVRWRCGIITIIADLLIAKDIFIVTIVRFCSEQEKLPVSVLVAAEPDWVAGLFMRTMRFFVSTCEKHETKAVLSSLKPKVRSQMPTITCLCFINLNRILIFFSQFF